MYLVLGASIGPAGAYRKMYLCPVPQKKFGVHRTKEFEGKPQHFSLRRK
jgi:hypothetical protein